MEQSAVSHQLRLLRNLGLVTGDRRGRHIVHTLVDSHVAELIDQAVHHAEHLRLGQIDWSLRDGSQVALHRGSVDGSDDQRR